MNMIETEKKGKEKNELLNKKKKRTSEFNKKDEDKE